MVDAFRLLDRLLPRRSHKIGLPPGSLVYSGLERDAPVRISCIEYDGAEFLESTDLESIPGAPPADRVRWINVDGVHDTGIVQQVGDRFTVHPLTLEDVVSAGQRPRIDDTTLPLFIVIDMLTFNPRQRTVEIEQVTLLVGEGFVVSFQEKAGDVLEPVRERLRQAKGRIRTRGADYLAYAIIDAIVDNYFLVIEQLGDVLVELEEEVFDRARRETRRRLSTLRRELILLRRAIWPVRELISQFERSDTTVLTEDTRRYLRDTYDHTVQIIDVIESMREMTAGLMELYVSELSHRLNETMKLLTMIGTVFIPLTFIVGVYGMNFEYMPELAWPWAYPAILLFMLAIAGGMVIYFRIKKWI
jgi:magnesium transporter